MLLDFLFNFRKYWKYLRGLIHSNLLILFTILSRWGVSIIWNGLEPDSETIALFPAAAVLGGPLHGIDHDFHGRAAEDLGIAFDA